jgi:NADPH:quinone reductase
MGRKKMKSIRVHEFGGPEVLKLEEIPDPKPTSNQILVTIRAVGINPVDTYIRAGTYPLKPPLPYTPGTDAAGVIESVGDKVDRFKPGDRVWVSGTSDISLGTYSQKTLCNPNQVYPLPDKLTFQQGAAVNVPYITAYHALFQVACAIAGETVLVHGATGGVGLAATQLAVSRGLTVIGTGSTQEGRSLVKAQGASHVLDHSNPAYLDEIMQITNGKGVNVICEMLANKNLAKDLQLLARNGRVAIIGSRGKIEIDPRDLMKSHGKALGVSPGTEAERYESTAAITAGLFGGILNPIVDQEYPLAEASHAHEEILSSGSKGKIVLIP